MRTKGNYSSIQLHFKNQFFLSPFYFIYRKRKKKVVAGYRIPSAAYLFSGDGFRRVAAVPAGGPLNGQPHSVGADAEVAVGEGNLERLLRQLEAGGGDEQRGGVGARAGELRGFRGRVHDRRAVPEGLRSCWEFVVGVREERENGRRRKRRVGVRHRRDAPLQRALLSTNWIRVSDDYADWV